MKKLHVTDYIKERITDETFEYSGTMLHKIYDITGYICGYMIYNLIHLNRLRTDYKAIFQNYSTNSRLTDGNTCKVCLQNVYGIISILQADLALMQYVRQLIEHLCNDFERLPCNQYEKRMKLGKNMILQFEIDRCSSRSICGTKVCEFIPSASHF